MLTESELARRVGPVLSDGTALAKLVDLDDREISMRVLSDPELHRLELKRVFAHSWIGVGHTSEIPHPGDFVLRYIGEDAVIVTRDEGGEVKILLNVCAHRGMEVCWAEQGNASTFKCPYHGWAFDNSGRLLGAPFEKQMYGGWDKSKYGLRGARVATRHGLIFGTFDPSLPSFDEYIGDLGWYLDVMYGQHEFEALGPPVRQMVHSNWKARADQLAGDVYHGQSLHHSISELGLIKGNPLEIDDVKVSFPPLGHGVLSFNPVRVGDDDFGGKKSPYAFEGRCFNALIFPSTNGAGTQPVTRPDGSIGATASMGGMVPRGVDAFEFWHLSLIAKPASNEFKAKVRKLDQVRFMTIGTDDVECWPSMQRSASGVAGQEQTMKYLSMLGPSKPDDWPGPGTVHAGVTMDDNQWEFWLRWYDLMTSQAFVDS